MKMRKAGTARALTSLALLVLLRPGAAPMPVEAQEVADGLPFRLSVGAVARDGYAPVVSLSSTSAFQGGALRITVDNASAVSVSLFGRTSPLSTAGESLSGYVGFGTEDPPGPTTLTVFVTDLGGESRSYSRGLTVKRTQWTVDYIKLPPDVGGILDDPGAVLREQQRLDAPYRGVTERRWNDRWRSPVDTSLPISGYFGEQRSFNGGPVGGHHGGTDFGAGPGTPVMATNTGVVVLAETLFVRGNMVIIDHGGGVFSGYAHMEAMQVTVGDLVAAGNVIGHVGTTGLSTGAHLHWEMSVGGVLVDGLRWLDGTQGF